MLLSTIASCAGTAQAAVSLVQPKDNRTITMRENVRTARVAPYKLLNLLPQLLSRRRVGLYVFFPRFGRALFVHFVSFLRREGSSTTFLCSVPLPRGLGRFGRFGHGFPPRDIMWAGGWSNNTSGTVERPIYRQPGLCCGISYFSFSICP